jgi:hypothetical protein
LKPARQRRREDGSHAQRQAGACHEPKVSGQACDP